MHTLERYPGGATLDLTRRDLFVLTRALVHLRAAAPDFYRAETMHEELLALALATLRPGEDDVREYLKAPATHEGN